MKIFCGLLGFLVSATVTAYPLGSPQDLQARALRYFTENAHPTTGLVRDRARNFEPTPDYNAMASLAATGFGLAVVANAAQRGLMPYGDAKAQVRRTLETVERLAHHNGWLYHFVDWRTGARWGVSEISTIDTTWLVAGALYAAEVFPDLAANATALYRRVDFHDMLTDGGSQPWKRTISMGWLPERGYLAAQWNSYAEQMLLLLLGLGHPDRPLPADAWRAWSRDYQTLPTGETVLGGNLPLFVHQYSHLFVDFRRWSLPENFFQNSLDATNAHFKFCRDNHQYATYREGFWGLSAGDSPAGYEPFSIYRQNGTVCLGCAGGSAMVSPGVVNDLAGWATGWWGSRLYGRYGFTDSINIDRDWFDPDVIGITVGALYLSLANLETPTVWETFSRLDFLERAFRKIERQP